VKRHSSSGFSLIEVLMVIAISLVLAGIAIPGFMNALKSYNQSATVSAVTGAIESTRFLAIMRGYPYQMVFTASTLSFEVYNEIPPATTFSVVVPAQGSAITPLPNAGGVAMHGAATFTYTFCPNGTVFGAATACPGSAMPPSMQISNSVKSNTITVSGVGNVSTSIP